MAARKVLILGAAGRDFHNFNVYYRDDPDYEVVAFTATQIPDIAGRRYPAELAGHLYPGGIPILSEDRFEDVVLEQGVDDVVFAYSDVSHEYVMHKGSEAMAAGANFVLLGPDATMLDADVPVVSVCAVRTGAGKSQTTRAIAGVLKDAGKRVEGAEAKLAEEQTRLQQDTEERLDTELRRLQAESDAKIAEALTKVEADTQARMEQQAERLAHGGARDLQLGCDLALGQHAADGQGSAQDDVAQVLVGDLGQAPAAGGGGARDSGVGSFHRGGQRRRRLRATKRRFAGR